MHPSNLDYEQALKDIKKLDGDYLYKKYRITVDQTGKVFCHLTQTNFGTILSWLNHNTGKNGHQ